MNKTLLKGLILATVLAIVGVLILAIALNGPDNPSSTAPTTTTTTLPTETTPPIPVITARAPDATTVVVANGTDIVGAAGSITKELESLGYLTENAHDATNSPTRSNIFYFAGWEAEALKIAASLGVPSNFVAPIPIPFEGADVEEATIVIILGGPDELVPQSSTTTTATATTTS